MKMATDIVIAFLGQRAVEPEQLPELVRAVRTALAPSIEGDLDGLHPATLGIGDLPTSPPEDAAAPAPTMTPQASITDDYLISFEDGRPYRSLKRHLMSRYGMTPEEYRRKWGLPSDYPMVAPSYAKERSEVAKRTGLGGPPRANKTPKVRRPRSH